MRTRHLLAATAACLTLAAPPAAAADYSKEQVVVGYEDGASRVVPVDDGDTVRETLRELRRDPDVEYAVPDYKIRAAQAPAPFMPNDPGRNGSGGWRELQWNFAGEFGINAPQAWAYMRQTTAPGGAGAVVAVIDSGVAYKNAGRFRRAPDLYKKRWTAPYDFIDDDRSPLDEDGHGTHVTGTIAQSTNNRIGVTGLAYGVKIMPLRVLDENGDGDGSDLVRALRYAAQNGADVINMSVEFTSDQTAADIPEVVAAMRYAHRRGATLVGVSGNGGDERVSYPGRYSHAIAVGGTTAGGCLADYSNTGSGLDIVAPGGGQDASAAGNDWDQAHCDPTRRSQLIYQQTLAGAPSRFALLGFEGTSEAAPHVTAAAALVWADIRAAGGRPTPTAVKRRLESTARDIGEPGYDTRYGYGLLDAAAAVAP